MEMKKLKVLESKEKINYTAIKIILVFSAFLGLFNETILNVSLNILMDEMNITAGTVQWVVTAYMIVVAVMVPITAFLLQTFDIKKLYLTTMMVLLIGTIGAACSVSFAMLLASRMIQAISTGMMVSIMMTIVLTITPKEKHGTAMGICICTIQLGPALGPTVSGIILDYFRWNMIFIMLIPLIIILMILGSIYLTNVTTLTKPKIDIFSIILSTIGIGGIIYGLNGFSSGGDIKVNTIVSIIGLISLLVFGRRQLYLSEPMLEIRTFKHSLFSIGAVLVMISMMIIFTMNIMLPMLFQGALGTTAFVSAIAILPAILINVGITLVSGKIYDKIGVRYLLPIGYFIIIVTLFILSRLTEETSLITIVLIYIGVCIGIGSTLSPAQTNALSYLPKSAYPHGVAIQNTLQQLAAAIGSSLFLGIMSASQLKALNNLETNEAAIADGFTSAVSVMLIFALLGLFLSFTLNLINKKSSM